MLELTSSCISGDCNVASATTGSGTPELNPHLGHSSSEDIEERYAEKMGYMISMTQNSPGNIVGECGWQVGGGESSQSDCHESTVTVTVTRLRHVDATIT